MQVRILTLAGSLMLGAATVPTTVAAQMPSGKPVPSADFDAYVASAMTTLDAPGAAVAIVKDGKLVFAKGYGVKKVGSPAPVDTHTLFQIASGESHS